MREIASKTEQERRFYITSCALYRPDGLAPAIRDHWRIENSLHWVMDMIFRDDESRLRNGNTPANLAAIRHMAQNLIRARRGQALSQGQPQGRRLG